MVSSGCDAVGGGEHISAGGLKPDLGASPVQAGASDADRFTERLNGTSNRDERKNSVGLRPTLTGYGRTDDASRSVGGNGCLDLRRDGVRVNRSAVFTDPLWVPQLRARQDDD